MTPRITKAIDIFLDALNNGTLAKGDCAACAVGNLVAAGMKIPIKLYDDVKTEEDIQENEHWAVALNPMVLHFSPFSLEKGLKCIEVTDFSVPELRRIEKIFERNTNISYFSFKYYTKEQIRADQIKGLEAVIKVMLEFDEQPEEVFEVFTKKAELIAI